MHTLRGANVLCSGQGWQGKYVPILDNHRPEIVAGVLADECRALLQTFFRERRA